MFIFVVFSVTISLISIVIPSGDQLTHLTVCQDLKSEALIPTCNLPVFRNGTTTRTTGVIETNDKIYDSSEAQTFKKITTKGRGHLHPQLDSTCRLE